MTPGEIARLVKAAKEELSRLCQGGQWRMSIPVKEDRDSDRILGRAIDALAASEQRGKETEEAFEVWSSVVCQHGASGTHASLADLARCLLAQLQASKRALVLYMAEHNADSPAGRCTCQLCKDTRAALASPGSPQEKGK